MKTQEFLAAILFATAAHGNQTRKYSRDPYILHPIRVARLTRDYTGGNELIIPALFHDLVEDTGVTLEDIELAFGDSIAEIVAKVTDVKEHVRRAPSKGIFHYEKIRKFFDDDDYASIVLKLCDRLDNMLDARHNFVKSAYRITATMNPSSEMLELHTEIKRMCHLMIVNTRFILNFLFQKCDCRIIVKICKDLEKESDYLFSLIKL